VAPDASTITPAEYDELAALRKAHAWCTPMFQSSHPRYTEVIARLQELEAKVLLQSSDEFRRREAWHDSSLG
jgi:hypothetical protein